MFVYFAQDCLVWIFKKAVFAKNDSRNLACVWAVTKLKISKYEYGRCSFMTTNRDSSHICGVTEGPVTRVSTLQLRNCNGNTTAMKLALAVRG